MPFLLYQKYLIFSELTLLILTPTLDANVVQLDIAEGIDECRRKATVGDEGHVEVDGSTTNLVSVGELTGSEVLRDVHGCGACREPVAYHPQMANIPSHCQCRCR